MALNRLRKSAGSAARRVGRLFSPRADSTNVQEGTESVQMFFLCDGCGNPIEEGTIRYHCAECEISFDLCQSCADSGLASKHRDEKGHTHIFSLETKAMFLLAQHAKGETLEKTLYNIFSFYPTRQALGSYIPSKDRYEYITYAELKEFVEQCASGLQGLTAGSPDANDPVALCSTCCLEWYITDIACALLAKPTVGITTGTDEDTIAFILNQSESGTLVCSESSLPPFLSLASAGKCPHLRHIVVMDLKEGGVNEDVLQGGSCGGCQLLFFSELLARGERERVGDLWERTPDPKAIFTIAYTSGSTGNPKGCVFSRKNWNYRITKSVGGIMKVWLSFQPPSHLLERRTLYSILVGGGKSGIYRGDMEHLFSDIAMIRPTVVASTPRFFSLIYDQYMKALLDAVIAERKSVAMEQQFLDESAETQVYVASEPFADHGENCSGEVQSSGKGSATTDEASKDGEIPAGKEASPPGPPPPALTRALSRAMSTISESVMTDEDEAAEISLQLPVPEFNPRDVPYELKKKVMEPFRGLLGGREQVVCIGGAAVSRDLVIFLQECFKGMIVEGYGTTEAGGIAYEDTIADNVDLKLVDVPEMGYFTSDNPPRGEICVKTLEVIDGYYKNPVETQDKFVDGYFRTGDIGLQCAPDKIKIIDRKKNLFKLAQGEFVAPERVEGVFENCSSLIEQSYVYGSGLWTRVVAVVVPHADSLRQWCLSNLPAEEGSHDLEILCSLEVVNALYLSELRRIGQNQGLRPWEIPAAVLLEPCPFSSENRLLTATMKKARPQLERCYRTRLEELYAELSSGQGGSPVEQQVLDCFKSLITATESAGDVGDSGVGEGEGVTQPEAPTLDLSLTLAQLGGDSLAATRFSFFLQESFSVSVSASELLRVPLGDIFKQVLAKKGLRTSLPSTGGFAGTIDWEAEADISPLKETATGASLNVSQLPKGTIFLLTGVTGFLGRFILWELVNHECCRLVYCLARRSKSESAEERVKAILHKIFFELQASDQEMLVMPVLESVMEKVVVVEGNISQDNLGLSDPLYQQMVAEVDVVVHAAAQVNSVLPYAALKASNVKGTMETLLLCTRGKPKFLHYVSTVGVFTPLPGEVVTELVPPDSHRLKLLSGYSQCKWVSERMVLKAASSGLVSASVSRPGLIGAHSQTGHLNPQDWFYWLVAGVAHLGCYPTGPGCSERAVLTVPVDITAKAVVFLTLQSLGKKASIYHLTNDNESSAVQYVDVFNALSTYVNLRATDYSEFWDLLRTRAKESPDDTVLTSLELLLSPSGGLPRTILFRSSATRDVLACSGADCSLSDVRRNYANKYVQYLKKNYL